LLNRIVRNIDRWDLINAIEPGLFQNNEARSIFSAIYKIARDIAEGGEPPADWFSICKNEPERYAMDVILAHDALVAGGELQPEKLEATGLNFDAEYPEMVARLRRRKSRALRGEVGMKIRQTRGSHQENREPLDMLESLGEPVIHETRRLWGAEQG
jgi:hypothetical protein